MEPRATPESGIRWDRHRGLLFDWQLDEVAWEALDTPLGSVDVRPRTLELLNVSAKGLVINAVPSENQDATKPATGQATRVAQNGM